MHQSIESCLDDFLFYSYSYSNLTLLFDGRYLLTNPSDRFLSQLRNLIVDRYERNRIIFSLGSSVQFIHISTPKISYSISGSATRSGYHEGAQNEVRFNHIGGIVALRQGYLVSDKNNYCIRIIPRHPPYRVSTFAGKCQTQGDYDGFVNEARFGVLGSIVANPKDESKIYVYDMTNGVKSIAYILRANQSSVSLIVRTTSQRPFGDMVFENNHLYFVEGNNYKITYYNLVTETYSILFDTEGYLKQTTSDSLQFKSLLNLHFGTVLVTDFLNNKLRMLSFKNEISSICAGSRDTRASFRAGNISVCVLPQPRALCKHPTTNDIFISSITNIYRLTFEGISLVVIVILHVLNYQLYITVYWELAIPVASI